MLRASYTYPRYRNVATTASLLIQWPALIRVVGATISIFFSGSFPLEPQRGKCTQYYYY